MLNKEKGIVLLAMGSWYYGEMALNLCMSIRYNNPTIPITLYHHGMALNHIHQWANLFTEVKEIPSECITNKYGETDYIKAKTCLYDLSPYESTIYIDADVILFRNRNIKNLFEELKDIDFTIGCREKKKVEDCQKATTWVDSAALIDAYGWTGEIYNLSSEFIYFKKTKNVKKYFDLAKELYEEPNVDYLPFNGSVPDELPFMLSMIVNEDIKPHKVPYLPFYWEHQQKKMQQSWQIETEFWGYSMGGNALDKTGTQKTIYNGLATLYSRTFGTQMFMARSKRDIIEKRKAL